MDNWIWIHNKWWDSTAISKWDWKEIYQFKFTKRSTRGRVEGRGRVWRHVHSKGKKSIHLSFRLQSPWHETVKYEKKGKVREGRIYRTGERPGRRVPLRRWWKWGGGGGGRAMNQKSSAGSVKQNYYYIVHQLSVRLVRKTFGNKFWIISCFWASLFVPLSLQ